MEIVKVTMRDPKRKKKLKMKLKKICPFICNLNDVILLMNVMSFSSKLCIGLYRLFDCYVAT